MLNIESTAALKDEACYSQQAKGLEPIESMDRDAANLVITENSVRQRTQTRSQVLALHQEAFCFFCLFFSKYKKNIQEMTQ